MSISLELLIIAGLILANGFFAAAEVAVLTARRNRLEQQARSHNRSAQKALDLASNPAKFLPAVQVGITLIATLASAFGGATLARPLSDWLAASHFALLAENHAAIALAIGRPGADLRDDRLRRAHSQAVGPGQCRGGGPLGRLAHGGLAKHCPAGHLDHGNRLHRRALAAGLPQGPGEDRFHRRHRAPDPHGHAPGPARSGRADAGGPGLAAGRPHGARHHAAADRDRRPGRRHAGRRGDRRRGHGRLLAAADPRRRPRPYHRLRLHQGPSLAAAHGLADRIAEAGPPGLARARVAADRQAAGTLPAEADADGDRAGRVRRHGGPGDDGRRAGRTGRRDPRRAPRRASAADRRPRRFELVRRRRHALARAVGADGHGRSPRFAAGRREHGRGTGAFPAGANPRNGRIGCLGRIDAGSRGHGRAAAGADLDFPGTGERRITATQATIERHERDGGDAHPWKSKLALRPAS